MKLINKKTVLTVLLTMAFCFCLTAFTGQTKADVNTCTHENVVPIPDMVYNVYAPIGFDYAVQFYGRCQDCGATTPCRDADKIVYTNSKHECVCIDLDNPYDGKSYKVCINCHMLYENDTPQETEHEHVFNKNGKGKCKICGLKNNIN